MQSKRSKLIVGLMPDGIVGNRTWHALSKHGYLRVPSEEAFAVR
jgi:hypothetical protein